MSPSVMMSASIAGPSAGLRTRAPAARAPGAASMMQRPAKPGPAISFVRSLSGPTLAVRPASLASHRRPQRTGMSVCAAATPAAPAPAEPPAPVEPSFTWGAKMKPLLGCLALGVVMWFIPAPEGVPVKAWHLLSIFVATIAGIITSPLPLGAVAMLGLGAAMLTKTMTFAAAFSAFASEIP